MSRDIDSSAEVKAMQRLIDELIAGARDADVSDEAIITALEGAIADLRKGLS